MLGQFCRLEPLQLERHAIDLFEAYGVDDGRMWTYLGVGPFQDLLSYLEWINGASRSEDPLFFAIIDRSTGKALGSASYMRIDPPNGVIEVGHVTYSPKLQRTRAATEAMYLMMRHAFELGYRRYEWKCDALNAPSRAAAQRLGFTFEGIFRQAVVYKGRSRDTAWFSVLDSEWPMLRERFEKWLNPANFDPAGRQILSLSEMAN
jgi:RimJ/RimL family protein N-acetyltransferase